MLKPEIAEAQLKERASAVASARMFERIETLPLSLRYDVHGLRGYGIDNKEIKDWEQRKKAIEAATVSLAELNEADRKMLWV